ncbi:SIS domain-containing protein [Verrucosispora sp. CWR15]|uniref:SIS domain-containing protein n=1 Tax=Verrucosispora sioxanthis TaxID=2499994 RepID=A0A6M1L4G6_9ACTN|nr:SIS domain-containing protein [Verrucosispora sioxanthis]NEE62234.1 SIS domain-containing protein [Verrucosispora sioxanthis]NGM11344.1 SIS domain-containing protein [Verrucosispora sioxanthis]
MRRPTGWWPDESARRASGPPPTAALPPFRRCEPLLARWGRGSAGRLTDGGRLLVAGNGGSAAEAQHLTAELVGKLRDDRRPLSAIALRRDVGVDRDRQRLRLPGGLARQVRAHGRPDDVLLLLSTSGGSGNLLTAARAGREAGLRCWAFTGPAPNPLAEACHEVLAVDSPDTQVVQELHLVSSHLLCEYVEQAMGDQPAPAAPAAGPVRAGVEVVLDGGTVRPVQA